VFVGVWMWLDRLVLRGALLSSAVVLTACGLDRGGLAEVDGGDARLDVPPDPCVDAPLPETFDLCPFGTPRRIEVLSSPETDDDPTLTSDLLELYFNSFRDGDGDIYVSRRDSTSDPWGAPARVAELSTPSQETTPEVSPDGLTMWLSSNRPGSSTGDYDIWVSRRGDRADPWGAPEHVPELSTPDRDVAATPSGDGLEATVSCYSSSRGDWTLLLASRASVGDPWLSLVRITELDGPGSELDGYFDPSGSHLFFDGDLDPGTDRDLLLSLREDRTSAFESPAPIPDVNSDADEEDPWLSDDLRYLVFASERGGDLDLYEASR